MYHDDNTQHIKLGRFFSTSGKRRRRYLAVPKTERELRILENVYCDGHNGQQEQKIQETKAISRTDNRESIPNYDTSASSSQERSLRLIPSTQVLISMMNEETITGKTQTSTRPSTTHESLLFQNFYKCIGIEGDPRLKSTTKSMTDGSSIMSEKKIARQVIDEIDDPSLSTLTIGQHRRYLQLTTKNHQTSKRTFSQQKELGKLHKLVLKEQASYRLALDNFHAYYKSRYLLGFNSDSSGTYENGGKNNLSAFCRWACFRAQSINQEWEKNIKEQPDDKITNGIHHLPKRYGKVRQTIALHTSAQESTLDIQDLKCSVVYQAIMTPKAQLSSSSTTSLNAKIPEVSPEDIKGVRDGDVHRKIPPPTIDCTPDVQLLRNDSKALELATKYGATIVTTSETLETLLRLPGDFSAKWILPCVTRNITVRSPPSSSVSVRILDLPISLAFPSPRSCLEMGLQEGLYQAFFKEYKSSQEEKVSGEELPFRWQVVYSLWTLPSKNVGVKNGSRKLTQVIVRSVVRLRESVSKLPIRLRAHVEYFASPVASGLNTIASKTGSRIRREIPNSYEKSLWILDQVLFEHQVFCLQYRIDPTTCEVLGCDVTSVAHAFASSAIPNASKSNNNDLGPLDNWKVLIQLLQSIPSIDIPEALLCLPGLIGEKNKTANNASDEMLLEQRVTGMSHRDRHSLQQQVRLDPFSVSVHAPCEIPLASESRQTEEFPSADSASQSNFTSAGNISLDESVLGQAGTVILGEEALRNCRRNWEWDRSDLVPYTFPAADRETTKV